VSVVIFLFGLIAVYYVGSFITNPITSIVRTVEQIHAGDLTRRAKLNTADEIGYLAKSFNSMVDRIEETNEEMEMINKDLEARVKLRTQALTESESRFRSLYENSTLGIYRTTPDGYVLLANKSLLKMLGYNSLRELNKADYVTNGFEKPENRKKFLAEIEKNGVIIGFEQKWITKNGTKIYIRESARAVRNEQGKTIYYDGTVEDITSRKIMEDELISAKEKAEAAVKIKTQFLAQMSHEIRTPINSILSYAQLLKEEMFNTIPDDLKISFDMINSGGRRLIRTVDLILNMSELQTGTYEPIYERCDIVKILEQLVGEFKTSAESKELDLIFLNRLDKSESILAADIYTITQIFANLIDNAIKYTHQGSIEVVAYKNYEKLICVDVQDTGIGMSKKFQEVLFEAFSQEEQGYTRKFDGNGLGMSLVKEYCKINKAIISVDSEKGKGSNFTVAFSQLEDHNSIKINNKVKHVTNKKLFQSLNT
ncbi:MAG: ATP-binding protein, partial [Melioribacteraceae bacterium]|nr:ATP-binding protein [Melioribacteraceae bacterium]